MTRDKAKLKVANSPIHGKGLFAQDFIPAGTVLGKIQGFRTSGNGAYVLWIDETYPLRILCKFKYINHSDDPNVVLYDTREVCALCDIHPGDEITHDYANGELDEDGEYELEFASE